MSEVTRHIPKEGDDGDSVSAWERAMAANKRRTEEARQQIVDARGEPTVAELEAQAGDAQLQSVPEIVRPASGCKACDSFAWELDNGKAVILRGPALAAYRQLEVAAAAAHEAQQTMTTAGVALREAIQAMCAALAPGAK